MAWGQGGVYDLHQLRGIPAGCCTENLHFSFLVSLLPRRKGGCTSIFEGGKTTIWTLACWIDAGFGTGWVGVAL